MTVASWQGEYESFVRSSSARLERTAFLLTGGDSHLGEDLVQTALLATYRSWTGLRDVNAAASYARTALVNAHTDHFRRRRNREQPTEILPDSLALNEIAHADSRLAVLAALRRLSPRHRAVVVLRYYEDLTERQTAETLGCALGTVKSTCHQALRLLREMNEIAPEEDRRQPCA